MEFCTASFGNLSFHRLASLAGDSICCDCTYDYHNDYNDIRNGDDDRNDDDDVIT